MNNNLLERTTDELYRRGYVRPGYPRSDARWLAENHKIGRRLQLRLALRALWRACTFREPWA